ncbi:MAG: FAD-binding protein [Acidimicrobiales bacterium]|nr:FAD-binding protein [Acidimicrobiales bacterium]
MSVAADEGQGVLEADFLVVGAGMAGMTAAGFAAHHGASVVVVEKGPKIGGSAVLSGGGLWTAADVETLRSVNPQGDPELGRVLIEGYEAIGEWIESTGVAISERRPSDVIQGFASWGRSFDVLGYVQRCSRMVIDAGGAVVTGATVQQLIVENGQVAGAVVVDRDGETSVKAPFTLLSSGGFQNDPVLRKKYIGEHADSLLVRSNPNSAGDGLRLGMSVGAGISPHMDGWYGHTVPYPLQRFTPADYLRLAQFGLSPRSILLDRAGNRFIDESVGYYINAQMVSRLPAGHALLVFDDTARAEDASGFGAAEQIDRPREAAREGARVAEADHPGELDAMVKPWGFSGVATAIEQFNRDLANDTLSPPRKRNRCPLRKAPFFAMEVQPAITFTMGGLRIDGHARVLDERGQIIPGLLAAGVDAGGIYYMAYAGGLAYSGVFGMQAAENVLSARS